MAHRLQSSCKALALALRCAALGCAIGASLGGASAAVATSTSSAEVHPYAASVAEASQRFGIPERWIWRVMHAESRGNARALSHAGAMGLMQIMPATWAMLSARHGLGADSFDVRSNILAGAAYLRAMWDRYRDVPLMLAAYNAGPGRADAYASGRRGLPAETRAYVARIAPELDASGIAANAGAPASAAPGWQRSSLFAARGGDVSSVENRAPIMSDTGNKTDSPTVTARPIEDGPHPLFAPLSGQNR